MTAAYRRFRTEALAAATGFRLHRDEAYLARIAALLPSPDTVLDPSAYEIGFGAIGWIPPSVQLDLAATERLNPDYRIEVQRYGRPEFGPEAVRGRFGFRVTARRRKSGAGDPAERLAVRFCDLDGREVRLEAKSVTVRNALDLYDPERAAGDAPFVGGCIDWLGHALTWVAPGLEFAKFLVDYPPSLYLFADSEAGAPWRRLFADLLGHVSPLDEWTDRYRLTASGMDAPFGSGLEPLRVERHVDRMPASEDGVPVPLPSVQGDRVTFHAGPGRLPAPRVIWASWPDARVQDGGTVTVGDAFISYEEMADPAVVTIQHHSQVTFGSRAHPEAMLLRRFPETEEALDEAILLAGRYDHHWYPWLVECLPRVLTVPPEIAPDVPLLLTTRVPASGVDALRTVTSRPVVTVDPARSQRVRRLHVAPLAAEIAEDALGHWSDGLVIDAHLLREMRARWGVDVARAPGETGRRVFLKRRSGHRSARNELVLEEIAIEEGLEVVDPGALSFAEQRALFAAAELVVGASGAVATNYLLLRPGSRIVGLTSRQLGDYPLPAVLAEVAGCTFEYLTGRADVAHDRQRDISAWIHAGFTISPAAFRTTVRAAVKELTSR